MQLHHFTVFMSYWDLWGTLEQFDEPILHFYISRWSCHNSVALRYGYDRSSACSWASRRWPLSPWIFSQSYPGIAADAQGIVHIQPRIQTPYTGDTSGEQIWLPSTNSNILEQNTITADERIWTDCNQIKMFSYPSVRRAYMGWKLLSKYQCILFGKSDPGPGWGKVDHNV